MRCGNCVRACPAKVIQADSSDRGVFGWLAPVVRFTEDYCREDCTRCTEVCPSGALAPVTVEGKQRALIGFPRVDMDVCWLGDDRDCAVCRTHCPFDAISFRFDEETYTLTPEVNPERCPGCGACEVACPTQPTKAIVVYPL
jgi:ferredoxin